MKEKLLRLIEAGREKEAEIFLPHVDDSQPDQPGRWTVKDTVAHLTCWRRTAVAELDWVRTGREAPAVADEDDEQNAMFYAQTRDMPARAVLQSAARSWDDLAKAVSACTEEQLQAGRPQHPEIKVWLVAPQNAIDHIADHLEYFYADRGDAAAEEGAARWRYDTNVQAFDDDRRRGVEEYMLGRFFATHGRREEAQARLDRALELRPDLRGFAVEDPELKELVR
ncbi:MAG TPA: maleylpyruvate isomerase N-terminal domain-containing protein [Candidatus Dormibacteraeota bacterium]|nr:maleylpyruvate isomerase N-terminal domain-containing protein [Candidatus Dormibacteraeota bacterium]